MNGWGRGVIAAATLLLAAPVAAQEVHRVAGADVAIYNIAGSTEVRAGTSPDVVVRVTRGGEDGGQLAIETGQVRGRSTLRVIYPGDDVVYPQLGRGSSSTVSVRADGTFGDDGNGGDRVRVRGSGNGVEAWADLVVEVPSGMTAAVYVAVGEMTAQGVNADLRLDIGSGSITATDMSGALVIDTGSGEVSANRVRGDLSVDTGSGSVRVSEVTGSAIELDTGSGRVSATGLEAATSLNVDTGSGPVELLRVAAPNVVVDTGSGSVEIELLTDVDVLDIDTGSGSVTVRAPEDLGGQVEIDTGSGGIDLDFPLEVRSVRRDRVSGRLGDGDGTIRIDTGSGSIRIARAGS